MLSVRCLKIELLPAYNKGYDKKVRDPMLETALIKIPLSPGYLFDPESFTFILEAAGGVRKVFWPLNKDGKTANSSLRAHRFSSPRSRRAVRATTNCHRMIIHLTTIEIKLVMR
ncbi:unnamed protein product [Chilo suppressalis]|uniref:Uncharacterized protein n=1 Tax=Chilo suppressalis TaxID=168631 RepID=A0ABN8AU18_CHISP|nr:unnamed protein product [Chilo suppressalis]